MALEDLTDILSTGLTSEQRVDDGKLHPSTDLCGSLRHTQLRLAGAPTVDQPLTNSIRLNTGTLWHEWFADQFRKQHLPIMAEVKLDGYLPDGWSGTADWLLWSSEHKAFRLVDLKTTKGEGMSWIENRGAKEDHIWQVSSYFWALVTAGFPMVHEFGVYYLPMNEVPGKDVLPSIQLVKPISKTTVFGKMDERFKLATEYVMRRRLDLEAVVREHTFDWASMDDDEYDHVHFMVGLLEPGLPREQKIIWNSKTKVFDVKLTPNWRTRYCPYPETLCDCKTQKTEKIGHYTLEGCYVIVPGFEEMIPTAAPTEKDYERRRNG